MVSSAFDSLHVPDEFWVRDDVGNTLDHRDIGALFKLLSRHTGASQTRIGTATGLAQGTVCVIMNGSRTVSAIDVLERIADGLAIPDEGRLRLGLAPRGKPLDASGSGTEDPTKRRTALHLGLVTAISPDTLTSVLHDSAGEAMEFTRNTAVSAVGTGTLDHLEAILTDLDGSYWAKPPGELFAVARAYRRRVEELIQGQHTLKEERELYVYAAWLSELLAWLAHDFGFPLTAEAYARAALAVEESATLANRRPKREAIARIDLSIALVHLGSLDEATTHGSQALSSVRMVDSVLSRADELDKALMARFPSEAVAQGFHEQYRQLTRQANG